MSGYKRAVVLCFSLVVVAMIGGAAAHDAPATGSADWLATRSMAVSDLVGRFKGIQAVSCAPDRSSARKVIGSVVWWSRFRCAGATKRGLAFSLLYRATGKCGACWTITKLTGVTAAGLRAGGWAVRSRAADYTRSGRGHNAGGAAPGPRA